jgi:23S rRNA (cytidine1920-2'-O)/16S rRNA (cytidine1409-2'-O)-methyltransferase
VIVETAALAQGLGLTVAGLTVSPAPGPAGNVEFLIWLLSDAATQPFDVEEAIERVLAAAEKLER